MHTVIQITLHTLLQSTLKVHKVYGF